MNTRYMIENHPEFEMFTTCPGCKREHVLAYLWPRTFVRKVTSSWSDRAHTEYLRHRQCPFCEHQWQDYEKVYDY